MFSVETDVLIIGGGPVGLALSIDLSWRGIAHVLIDQAPRAARQVHPRMDQVGIRTMEHIRRWGAVGDIERAGFPRDLQRDIVFATGILGYELAREPVAADAVRMPPTFSPQKHELCPQNYFDPALQVIAERSQIADIRYDTKLLDFAESNTVTVADVENVATGARGRIAARYLVGCDGPSSFVAHKLAIASGAAVTLACSTNIFIESAQLSRRTDEHPAYRYILLDESGTWASMVRMDGRDLWRVQVLGDSQWPEWTPERAKTFVDRAIGAPVSYTLRSIVPWSRRELVVDRYSKGRSFLAGDSAHQLSPTGGYGMNTGIAEAMDLSWKLAATLEGWGGADLLDTYDAERRPIALENVRCATENFRKMRGIEGDPALLDATPQGTAARARIGKAVRDAMHDEWDSMGVHLGYHYFNSPIVWADDGEAPPHVQALYNPSSRPGCRAPHVWLADCHSILDLFGRAFTLLSFATDVNVAPLMNAAAARGVPMRLERINHPEAAQLYETRLVLVRPDGHVCWRGDFAPPDALAMIDRVRGHNLVSLRSASNRIGPLALAG